MSESGKAARKAEKRERAEQNTAPAQVQEAAAPIPVLTVGTLEAEKPAGESVTELANTQDGCWKVGGKGERVELTDAQWREELARLLAHRPTAG